MVQQPKESYPFSGCVCLFNVILLTIIMLCSFHYEKDASIGGLINQILKDNYTTIRNRCKLVSKNGISRPFRFYAKNTFDFEIVKEMNYFSANKSQATHTIYSSTNIIYSQVDIDNNIDRSLRIVLGNEWCRPEYFRLNPEIYGPHSTLIAHNYYHEKHDGNGGNLKYWKSLDNKTTFSPIYIPILWGHQFSQGFEQDILPFLSNYNITSQWSERQFMIAIVYGQHNPYRRSITPYLKETIGKNTHYKSFIQITHGFAVDNTKGTFLNTTQYRAILSNSKFTLCLYGNNPETFRLWESMVLGSIPIISVKNKNYFRRKCKRTFNGFLLHPNMTFKQIENNMLIWNENNWYYKDLDVNKLLHLNKTKQFVAPILLKKDYHLEFFLDFVAMNEMKNPEKSNEFWNVYQQLLNQWYINYIEYKMNQLKNIILSQLHANCSLK